MYNSVHDWMILIIFRKSAEVEWPSGLLHHACYLRHRQAWVWAPNLHQCLWTCLQVHGSKSPSCHADFYTVSRCCTRGECEDCTRKKACKRDPPWLWNPRKMSPEVQNSCISGPTKKDLCPAKVFLKDLKIAIKFICTWRYLSPLHVNFFVMLKMALQKQSIFAEITDSWLEWYKWTNLLTIDFGSPSLALLTRYISVSVSIFSPYKNIFN